MNTARSKLVHQQHQISYEALLDLVSKFGASVLNSEIIAGLSITEEFIAKLKQNEGAM